MVICTLEKRRLRITKNKIIRFDSSHSLQYLLGLLDVITTKVWLRESRGPD